MIKSPQSSDSVTSASLPTDGVSPRPPGPRFLWLVLVVNGSIIVSAVLMAALCCRRGGGLMATGPYTYIPGKYCVVYVCVTKTFKQFFSQLQHNYYGPKTGMTTKIIDAHAEYLRPSPDIVIVVHWSTKGSLVASSHDAGMPQNLDQPSFPGHSYIYRVHLVTSSSRSICQ